jgi:hypothetical protein
VLKVTLTELFIPRGVSFSGIRTLIFVECEFEEPPNISRCGTVEIYTSEGLHALPDHCCERLVVIDSSLAVLPAGVKDVKTYGCMFHAPYPTGIESLEWHRMSPGALNLIGENRRTLTFIDASYTQYHILNQLGPLPNLNTLVVAHATMDRFPAAGRLEHVNIQGTSIQIPDGMPLKSLIMYGCDVANVAPGVLRGVKKLGISGHQFQDAADYEQFLQGLNPETLVDEYSDDEEEDIGTPVAEILTQFADAPDDDEDDDDDDDDEDDEDDGSEFDANLDDLFAVMGDNELDPL